MGAKSLRAAGDIVQEFSVDAALRAQDKAMRAFRPNPFRSGDATPAHVAYPLQAMTAILGSPSDRMLQELAINAGDDASLRRLHNLLRGEAPDASIPAQAFDDFKEKMVGEQTRTRAIGDARAVAGRNQVLQNALDELAATVEGQAARGGKIDEAMRTAWPEQLRKLHNDFSIGSLRYDAVRPSHGLTARATLGTMMAKTTGDAIRGNIRRAYKDRTIRNVMEDLWPRIIDAPDAWRIDAATGRAFLKDATAVMAEKTDFPLLKKLIQEGSASKKGQGLLRHLTEEGVHEDVVEVAQMVGRSLDIIGENLMDTQILRGLLREYFPRVFTANNKFFKAFKGSQTQTSTFFEQIGETNVADRVLRDILGAERGTLESAARGKLSFTEARKFTERMAIRLEEAGYGTLKRDGVGILAGYLDGASKALLVKRVFQDLPNISPALTRASIIEDIGEELADAIDDRSLSKLRRVMLADENPNADLFAEIKGPRGQTFDPSVPMGGSVFRKREEIREAKRLRTLHLAREGVAASLDGARRVGDIPVLDTITGASIPFREDWVLLDSFPGGLANRMAIKREVRKMVSRRAGSKGIQRKVAGEIRQVKLDLRAPSKALKAQRTFVYKPDHRLMQEVFGLYDTKGHTSAFWRAYDRWNYGLKGAVLLGDIFHFNTLGVGQFLTNPMSVLAHLRDDFKQLLPGVAEGGFKRPGVLASTVAGAAGGAVAGSALGGDEGETVAFSIAGAIYGAVIGAAVRNAKVGQRLFFNPDYLDDMRWMGLGGWQGRPDDRSIGAAQRFLGSMERSLRNSGAPEVLISPITGARHVADLWDEQLWGLMHNGSKHFYFHHRWRALQPELEKSARWGEKTLRKSYDDLLELGAKGSDEAAAKVFRPNGQPVSFEEFRDAERFVMQRELATEIVQSSNNIFGGQNFRFLLEQPQTARTLRRLMLSPDWTLSRLKLGADMLMNMNTPERAAVGATLGAAMEMANHGFDVEETGVPTRGLAFGALGGVLGGRWAQRSATRMGVQGDVMAGEARRIMGAALAAGYVFFNLVNYGLSGHFMWDNEEGKQLSVELPGRDANGAKKYVSPGKAFKEPFEALAIIEAEKFPIPFASRLGSKLSIPAGAVVRVFGNRTIFGPIASGEDNAAEVGYKLFDFAVDSTTPIIFQGPLRAAARIPEQGFDPRDAGLAGLRFGGVPVSGGRRGAGVGQQAARLVGGRSRGTAPRVGVSSAQPPTGIR